MAKRWRKVVDNNEYFGLIVSGTEEEEKNIDENIIKCRGSLFALLGPEFDYKCLLSPLLHIHLWRRYILPVLVSGLSVLPIRPTKIISFQIKIMSGIPKLSNTSPIPALYFLPWELLADGIVHINTPNLPSYLEQPRHNSLKECLVHPHDVQEQLNHMEQPPIALQEVFPAISSCSSAKWISLV